MSRPLKLGPLRLHFQEDVAAPRAEVFAFFADHERFGTVFAPPFAAEPGRLIRRTRAADGEDPNGLGSVRAATLGPLTLIEEVIVAYQPDALIEYAATRGPIRNHLGRIEFSDGADGSTHIDYRIWLDGKLPGLGALIARQLRSAWRGGWRRAAKELESGGNR